MATSDDRWSWPVFFSAFWGGFGRAMAAFSLIFLVLWFFSDTSSASFWSAMAGWFFADLVSLISGYSEGEDAVRICDCYLP